MSNTRWFIGKEISPDSFRPYVDGDTTVWLMVKTINGKDTLVGIHHPDGAQASEDWYNANKAMLDEMFRDKEN
jgi:hypothetical protein